MKILSSLKLPVIPLKYIIALNLVIKLVMFGLMYHGQNFTGSTLDIKASDEVSYDFIAHDIINYHTFAPPQHVVDSLVRIANKPHVLCEYYDAIRLPGYPVFVAAIYFITGIKPYIAILAQILLSLLMIPLVYRICMLLWNNKSIASVASLLFAIDIHTIFITDMLLTDALCTLFMLASVLYTIKAIYTPRNLYIIISGLFMGIACIMRPVMVLYPFVALFVFFIFGKDNLVQKLKMCSLYALLSYVFLIAWVYRNHVFYKHWDFTTQSGYNLTMWNVAFTESAVFHKNADSVRKQIQAQADSMNFDNTPNPYDRSAIYLKIGSAYFKQHKWDMIRTHINGGLHMFVSVGNIEMAQAFGWRTKDVRGFPEMNVQRIAKNFSGKKETALAIVILFIMMLQYIGSIPGMMALWRSRNYMFLVLCVLTVAYFTLVTGVAGMYRYKMPFIPFICALAAYGYYWILNRKALLKNTD